MSNKERSILIIANPTSNKGRGRNRAEAVRTVLISSDASCKVAYTTGPGDARTIATRCCTGEDAGKYDTLVACGGDGTIQEVAHAIAQTSQKEVERNGAPLPWLGLAPSGRCNDFARAMDVSTSVDAIARVLLQATPTSVDMGKVNDRIFCTVATAGIDAEVTAYVDRMKIPLRGTPAYIYAVMRVLMYYDAPHMRLTGDFGELDGRFFVASSANTSSYGGAIPIAPEASETDGLLDICCIPRISKLRGLRVVREAMRGRHTELPEVQILRTKFLTIETPKKPVQLWADGELVGETPATIQAIPSAIWVLRGGP